MTSIVGFGSVVLVLGLAQLFSWKLQEAKRTSFRDWIGTSQAWDRWAIFAAVAIYMVTLLAVEWLLGVAETPAKRASRSTALSIGPCGLQYGRGSPFTGRGNDRQTAGGDCRTPTDGRIENNGEHMTKECTEWLPTTSARP